MVCCLCCVCVSFNIFVCGACGKLCNAVWWVVLFCASVVRLCVFSFMCSWVLFVNYCVVMYDLVLRVLCLLVSVPCS